MIVEIKNDDGSGKNELCICEFQGEITGELKGNDLGCITLLEVTSSLQHPPAVPLLIPRTNLIIVTSDLISLFLCPSVDFLTF